MPGGGGRMPSMIPYDVCNLMKPRRRAELEKGTRGRASILIFVHSTYDTYGTYDTIHLTSGNTVNHVIRIMKRKVDS